MGKIIRMISAVLCFVLVSGVFLYTVEQVYDKRTAGRYYDEIGEIYGSVDKNTSIELQRKSAEREDNILIFGSSELGSVQKPFYPVDFFYAKKNGFQVNLIGRGYTQSIIHSVNLAAIGDTLKGQKIVLIVSPQWFTKSGLKSAEFNMNFSELQFYSMMFNDGLDKSLKMDTAKRIGQLAGENNEFGHIKHFCALYTADNVLSKAVLTMLMPYYRFKYYLLTVRDKIKSNHLLDLYKARDEVLPTRRTTFDWEAERKNAVEKGKQEANNNEFLIENSYYDTYIKDNLNGYKNSYKGQSYLESPEYDDLKLLLNICKEKDIKPLVISVPVHGKWYDYCGFDKEDRQGYYKKVKDIVTSYGFEIADFSDHEYDDYFLKDIMHLGWKGWVYVDEAIDKYFYGTK